MTKTQTWEAVSALLVEAKASKKLQAELEAILAPKSSGSVNPPKLDKDGNIVEAYCRFHQRYEVVDNMVMSGGKSKGYCKASISLWNKTNANIKRLNEQAVTAMGEGNMEEAQSLAKEATTLKTNLNAPETYDYDRDWAEFNKPTKETK